MLLVEKTAKRLKSGSLPPVRKNGLLRRRGFGKAPARLLPPAIRMGKNIGHGAKKLFETGRPPKRRTKPILRHRRSKIRTKQRKIAGRQIQSRRRIARRLLARHRQPPQLLPRRAQRTHLRHKPPEPRLIRRSGTRLSPPPGSPRHIPHEQRIRIRLRLRMERQTTVNRRPAPLTLPRPRPLRLRLHPLPEILNLQIRPLLHRVQTDKAHPLAFTETAGNTGFTHLIDLQRIQMRAQHSRAGIIAAVIVRHRKQTAVKHLRLPITERSKTIRSQNRSS